MPKTSGKKAVVWGSGSKGVAFLTALNLHTPDCEIEYVVDINPFREGKYMAGTGQEIVSPAFLKRYKPDLAIAMNPIYQPEIKADLEFQARAGFKPGFDSSSRFDCHSASFCAAICAIVRPVLTD